MEFTILMPCLNEAETLKSCIQKAKNGIAHNNLVAEILVADNGSTDGSIDMALHLGARVIHVDDKGYGNALRAGIEHAKGKYIIMGDSDDSYDFEDISLFVAKLREGNDLVMGNRFKGGIMKGAMPFLHRYLGNPVLSFIGRLFFKIKIGDFHCGLRGFNRNAILDIGLNSTGMEFASEMVVRSSLNNLKISEVPTTLQPDGRSRPPHLRTWRDGWRHLRFLLMYSPKWLFLYPGAILTITGLIITAILFGGPVQIKSVTFDIHTMLYSSIMIIIGFQVLTFYFLSKIYAIKAGLDNNKKWLGSFDKFFSLERALISGGLVFMAGLFLTIYSIGVWNSKSFGNLDPVQTFRFVIPSSTFLVLGIQMVFNSFFTSILNMQARGTIKYS
ncbi:dolichol-P-glucose synthetase [Niastella vici]|uniref:Dolichol-P-glucose synthetase n=1 Tax=Niastella vici TaxID=1703345 RepID=A0A1V9FRQ6_9BACT|nr:glycosyltransferase family 2 protein [Niastella vici]OQP61069.1 dolichol-P-glucose synthetase [Niastella vici]